MFEFLKKDPDKLLKQASALKRAGDWDGAIGALREAYRAIGDNEDGYQVQTFLRLPKYLQGAGKSDEAWKEFNKLLVQGYPNQNRKREFILWDYGAIYGAMQLFLQREKKHIQAVRFGIFSFLCAASALKIQRRDEELEEQMSSDSIKGLVEDLLKKTGAEHLSYSLVELIAAKTAKLPDIDFGKLAKDIDVVLNTRTAS